MSRIILVAAALAGALTVSAVPAIAAERAVEVRYGDLDLSTEAGVAKLQKRVALAVKQVCGVADVRNIAERQDMLRCRKEASSRSSRDVALALDAARNSEQLARLTVKE